MSKTVGIIIALLILAGAVMYFSKGDAPEATPNEDQVNMEQTVPGSDVDDMVVEELEPNEDDTMMEEEGTSTQVEFTIDSFSFGYSEDEIRVKEGDTVTINLTNSGGFHDWVVDEFDAATEKIQEGGETSVTFVADKKGEFEFYCSVGNHREQGMVGKLIVE